MITSHDPLPAASQAPRSDYDAPSLREMTDEIIHEEEEAIRKPEVLPPPHEDWMHMYSGRKMEENY